MEYDADDTEGWVTVPQSSSWSNLLGVTVSVTQFTVSTFLLLTAIFQGGLGLGPFKVNGGLNLGR